MGEKRQHHKAYTLDRGVVSALHDYSRASKLRRACLQMAAWSLSNEERAKVRSHFLEMDSSRQGTINFTDFRRAMNDAGYNDDKLQERFDALASSKYCGIQYSEFLAAMLSVKIDLHGDLLRSTFRRFDAEGVGRLTSGSLRRVLGAGMDAGALVGESGESVNSQISLPEFSVYLREAKPEDGYASTLVQERSMSWSWAKLFKTLDEGFRSLAVATVCGAFLDSAA